MTFEHTTRIADAVLFEGYILYPYRASSTKNRFRWTFGVIAPRAFSERDRSEPWTRSTQVLATRPSIRGRLRFLHVRRRTIEVFRDGAYHETEALEIDGRKLVPWEEGEVRTIDFELESAYGELRLRIPAGVETESIDTRARIVRTNDAIDACLKMRVDPVGRWSRVSITIENHTPVPSDTSRARVMSSSLVSAHVLLACPDGSFASPIDPPSDAVECQSDGLFPALVGDIILCAPIILPDDPAIAPESPCDFFDATEIDELLTLRTLTLTEAEKLEMRHVDARAAAILHRVETMSDEDRRRLHGAIRRPYEKGMRVRLRPGARRTDAQDILFHGRVATIEEVRQDIEGRDMFAVTVDDDPASEMHRWYGRFQYYYADELEPAS